jgi:hypothetical protein
MLRNWRGQFSAKTQAKASAAPSPSRLLRRLRDVSVELFCKAAAKQRAPSSEILFLHKTRVLRPTPLLPSSFAMEHAPISPILHAPKSRCTSVLVSNVAARHCAPSSAKELAPQSSNRPSKVFCPSAAIALQGSVSRFRSLTDVRVWF